MKLIVEEVGLEEYTFESGDQRDSYTKVEYYIKVKIDDLWYVNKDKHYKLEQALTLRENLRKGMGK